MLTADDDVCPTDGAALPAGRTHRPLTGPLPRKRERAWGFQEENGDTAEYRQPVLD